METPALIELAKRVRHRILTMTHAAGSGHPTSSFSAVELMTALFFHHLRFDVAHPESDNNDRVIVSKGHASALYYALFEAAGVITEKDLDGYRTTGSVLEGHPTSRFAFTEAATGSLGQGLSVGIGLAMGIRMHGIAGPYTMPRVYVLMGDGELAEGSVWEAASHAGFQKLHNLIALVDVNRLGQAGPTMFGHDTGVLARRFEAFGWVTVTIDGHDYTQIDAAYRKAIMYKDGPVAILAKTIKGKGVRAWEDKDGWHNKMLPPDELSKALAVFGDFDRSIIGRIETPESGVKLRVPQGKPGRLPPMTSYAKGDSVTTKKAFGNALVRLGTLYPELLVMDGDMANSTHTDQFRAAYPDRFLEMYIAEQNMAGVAVGLARQGFTPFLSTFACFLTRAHDQFRMMPLSDVTVYINGTYVGVSLGKDGPSQMGLEDIALFRAIYGSTVLYPSDAVSTERLVEEMFSRKGVVYLRTARAESPVIYDAGDTFPVGGSKVFQPDINNAKTEVTVVAAGVTLHEALKAQKELAKEKIPVRVIDCYSVKPIDTATLTKAAAETKAVVVVEDHYPEGGLGEAVKSVLAAKPTVPVYHLAVHKMPRSGKAEELMDFEGIAAGDIMETVRTVVGLTKQDHHKKDSQQDSQGLRRKSTRAGAKAGVKM